MKKTISIIILTMSFIGIGYSQSGQVYLEAGAGTYYNNIYQARFGLEFTKKYHNSLSVYGDVLFFNGTDEMEFLVGPTYKNTLVRAKNIFLKWPIGASIGTNRNDFIGAVNTGLEFGLVSEGNIIFTVSQNNQIAFWSNRTWRFGLMAGIKIPLN